jgi:hypothetical protein
MHPDRPESGRGSGRAPCRRAAPDETLIAIEDSIA